MCIHKHAGIVTGKREKSRLLISPEVVCRQGCRMSSAAINFFPGGSSPCEVSSQTRQCILSRKKKTRQSLPTFYQTRFARRDVSAQSMAQCHPRCSSRFQACATGVASQPLYRLQYSPTIPTVLWGIICVFSFRFLAAMIFLKMLPSSARVSYETFLDRSNTFVFRTRYHSQSHHFVNYIAFAHSFVFSQSWRRKYPWLTYNTLGWSSTCPTEFLSTCTLHTCMHKYTYAGVRLSVSAHKIKEHLSRCQYGKVPLRRVVSNTRYTYSRDGKARVYTGRIIIIVPQRVCSVSSPAKGLRWWGIALLRYTR